MRLHHHVSLLAYLCLSTCLATAQDHPAPPPTPPVPGTSSAPLVDVDGRPLERGQLPASTTKIARERWEKVLAASLPAQKSADPSAPAPARAPVTAFDLAIDIRYRATDSSTNDMPNARYQWLAPGFLRADTGLSTAHVRGPEGSYYVNEKDPDHIERIKLDVDRTAIEDRRLMDEYAGIAGNFARLTDPQSVRMRKLAEMAAPPDVLPDTLKKGAQALAWIELESPDFYVVRAANPSNSLARVNLGVDVITNRVQIALVDDARANSSVSETTTVLTLADYKPVDGFQVPHHIFVWLTELPGKDDVIQKPALRQKPTMDLFVKSATLRATLKPVDFLPTVPLSRPIPR